MTENGISESLPSEVTTKLNFDKLKKISIEQTIHNPIILDYPQIIYSLFFLLIHERDGQVLGVLSQKRNRNQTCWILQSFSLLSS